MPALLVKFVKGILILPLVAFALYGWQYGLVATTLLSASLFLAIIMAYNPRRIWQRMPPTNRWVKRLAYLVFASILFVFGIDATVTPEQREARRMERAAVAESTATPTFKKEVLLLPTLIPNGPTSTVIPSTPVVASTPASFTVTPIPSTPTPTVTPVPATATSVSVGEETVIDETEEFTVREYRIYRALIDSPFSIPEDQALRQLSEEYGLPSAKIKYVVDKVQRILFTKKWFGTPDSEVRHAVDWDPSKRDPLDDMVIAFEGSWSRSQIQTRLDLALRLYGREITDENRSRAGSVLVVMRQQYGVPEMAILEHMICSHVGDMKISFPDMAALSTVSVKNGDHC